MSERRVMAIVPALATAALAMTAGAAGSPPNVVVVAAAGVEIPSTLPGECVFRGSVRQVLEGRAYKVGQAVAIRVPCDDQVRIERRSPPLPKPQPFGPQAGRNEVRRIPAPALRSARTAVARLDGAGRLVWSASAKRYPRICSFTGFRVLDPNASRLADLR